jgi:hypothetical protein
MESAHFCSRPYRELLGVGCLQGICNLFDDLRGHLREACGDAQLETRPRRRRAEADGDVGSGVRGWATIEPTAASFFGAYLDQNEICWLTY